MQSSVRDIWGAKRKEARRTDTIFDSYKHNEHSHLKPNKQ